MWPHVTILGLFASFVYWNDGVVLGQLLNDVNPKNYTNKEQETSPTMLRLSILPKCYIYGPCLPFSRHLF